VAGRSARGRPATGFRRARCRGCRCRGCRTSNSRCSAGLRSRACRSAGSTYPAGGWSNTRIETGRRTPVALHRRRVGRRNDRTRAAHQVELEVAGANARRRPGRFLLGRYGARGRRIVASGTHLDISGVLRHVGDPADEEPGAKDDPRHRRADRDGSASPALKPGFASKSLLSALSHFVDVQDWTKAGRHVAGQAFWAATISSSPSAARDCCIRPVGNWL
jgi:hypothetical protein